MVTTSIKPWTNDYSLVKVVTNENLSKEETEAIALAVRRAYIWNRCALQDRNPNECEILREVRKMCFDLSKRIISINFR